MKDNFKTFKMGIKEIHRLQPWVIPATVFYAFLNALGPFINIYMSARIIDELVSRRSVDRLIFLVAITIGLNLSIHLLVKGLNHLKMLLRGIMGQNQDMRINEKIIQMDYEHVEDPQVHILRSKIWDAQNMNGGGIYSLILNLEVLVQGIVIVATSIALVVGLFQSGTRVDGPLSFINSKLFSIGFLALILLGTIINLQLSTRLQKKFFSYYGQVMDGNRNALY